MQALLRSEARKLTACVMAAIVPGMAENRFALAAHRPVRGMREEKPED